MIKCSVFIGLLFSMLLFFISLMAFIVMPISIDRVLHSAWAQMEMIGSFDSRIFWSVFFRA